MLRMTLPDEAHERKLVSRGQGRLEERINLFSTLLPRVLHPFGIALDISLQRIVRERHEFELDEQGFFTCPKKRFSIHFSRFSSSQRTHTPSGSLSKKEALMAQG